MKSLISISMLLAISSCEATNEDVAAKTEALAVEGVDQQEAVEHPVAEPAVLLASEDYVPEMGEDLDGDGVPVPDDPDDRNPFRYPGAPEQPCSGVDEDGDGVDECPRDVDGDGASEWIDCDDLDPAISPYAREVRCNRRDENCTGVDECDRDEDRVDDAVDADPDDPGVGRRP